MPQRRSPKKMDANGLWEHALKTLERRPHSTAELRRKLGPRAENGQTLDEVMAKLREYDLVNDRKFSEHFASSRLESQGLGRWRVLRDLRSKQVAGSVAQEAVQKAFAGTEETDLIRRFLQRKYRGKDLPVLLQEERELASVYRRLRTAGFSHAGSLSVLQQFRSDIQDIDEEHEFEAG